MLPPLKNPCTLLELVCCGSTLQLVECCGSTMGLLRSAGIAFIVSVLHSSDAAVAPPSTLRMRMSLGGHVVKGVRYLE